MLIQIFEERGYDGSYRSVWRHAQAWQRECGSVLSPVEFERQQERRTDGVY